MTFVPEPGGVQEHLQEVNVTFEYDWSALCAKVTENSNKMNLKLVQEGVGGKYDIYMFVVLEIDYVLFLRIQDDAWWCCYPALNYKVDE